MKLTLRELFLIVALVAMWLGWWVDRARFLRREATARANYSRYTGMTVKELDDLFGEEWYSEEFQPPVQGVRP
jgi:hypothetical protein